MVLTASTTLNAFRGYWRSSGKPFFPRKAEVSYGLSIKHHSYGMGFQKLDLESLPENETPDVWLCCQWALYSKYWILGEKMSLKFPFFNKEENAVHRIIWSLFLKRLVFVILLCVLHNEDSKVF